VQLRNCGWSSEPRGSIAARPVWARKETASFACPKSVISSQSLEMLERFSYWKICGGSLMDEEAKVADSILFLNEQWVKEQHDGETER